MGFYDFNAAMILETTDYLLDCFVSSYSISITRNPLSECYFSLIALIFTSSLKALNGLIHQALTKELNPGSGPRAVYQEARHWQQLINADFHSRLIRTSFIQLLLSCSFILNAKAGRYVTRTHSTLQNIFKCSVILTCSEALIYFVQRS